MMVNDDDIHHIQTMFMCEKMQNKMIDKERVRSDKMKITSNTT